MRVNTDELNRQAAELKCIAARINDIEDTVLWVSQELRRECFGEQFRPPLYNMAVSIASRAEELSRMSSALKQISVLYEKAEGRVVDEAEHANVHYDRETPTLITIPGIWQRFQWQTRPTNPYYIHLPTDPAEDVQVVDGLPTLDDIGWEDVVERVGDNSNEGSHPNPGPDITDALRDAVNGRFDAEHGRGYIPPVELPGFDPIRISQNSADQSGLIDWTPWDA